jgi:GNAT superfamily N-acetyltransferase
MIVQQVQGKRELLTFYAMPKRVYDGNPYHRSTEETLTRLIVDGPTLFHTHATVSPSLIWNDREPVGRCALIHDRNMPEFVQVAFFEALPELTGVTEALIAAARSMRTGAAKLLVGLNGHLNFGAGILLNCFDEPPVFGLPYTPPYYPEYFAKLFCRESVSFRFPLKGVYDWARKAAGTFDTRGVTVRFLNKRNLRKEIEVYTYIDNTSFSNATYWSNRTPGENYELFHPFRFLMKEEDLLFAEKDGKPIGFLLWYPDFNGLVPPGRDLNLLDMLRFHIANPLRATRLAEVAVLPQYRRLPVMATLLLKSLPTVERRGYEICEGGFIFQENRSSIVMTQRYIERGLGHKLDPHRHYGMFEAEL